MEKKDSYLKLLIGKTVTGLEYNTSTIAPINSGSNDPSTIRTSIFIQFYFEDYRLNIYNLITIYPSDKEMNDFIGLKVAQTEENQDEARLAFNNGFIIIVNMRDEAYTDPEAMYLAGPGNFWVVWN